MDEWRRTLGHTDWLEWLATEDVQELLLQWRELHAMADWLNALPDELTTFDALETEQRRRAASARDLIADQGLLDRGAQLAQSLFAIARAHRCNRAAVPERTAGVDAGARERRRSQVARFAGAQTRLC